jgi:hypothetical protein
MMKKLIVTLIGVTLLINPLIAFSGNLASTGVLVGAAVGAAKDGKVLKGALIGAGVGVLAEVLRGSQAYPYYYPYYSPSYPPYYSYPAPYYHYRSWNSETGCYDNGITFMCPR